MSLWMGQGISTLFLHVAGWGGQSYGWRPLSLPQGIQQDDPILGQMGNMAGAAPPEACAGSMGAGSARSAPSRAPGRPGLGYLWVALLALKTVRGEGAPGAEWGSPRRAAACCGGCWGGRPQRTSLVCWTEEHCSPHSFASSPGPNPLTPGSLTSLPFFPTQKTFWNPRV